MSILQKNIFDEIIITGFYTFVIEFSIQFDENVFHLMRIWLLQEFFVAIISVIKLQEFFLCDTVVK